MQEEIIKVQTSKDFLDTIIKSYLLKDKLKLEKNPLLFVLITNNNEFSDYLYNKGYTINSLAEFYKIELKDNFYLENTFTNQEINEIIEEELNNMYYLNQLRQGLILECKDIYNKLCIEDYNHIKLLEK